MSEIERDLYAIGELLDAPAAPALSAQVQRRIAPRQRRRVTLVAAALAAIGVASLNTPVVADWLRAGGVDIRRQSPPTTGAPQPLLLGQRSVLAASDAVPSVLGAPDEVWRSGAVVWLAYRPRPSLPEAGATGYGALLSQSHRSLPDDLLATKFVEPTTKIEPVALGTGRAYWVEGIHYFALLTPSGDIEVEQVRLAGNVLLWERGDLVLRLESALSRDEALRIARSVD